MGNQTIQEEEEDAAAAATSSFQLGAPITPGNNKGGARQGGGKGGKGGSGDPGSSIGVYPTSVGSGLSVGPPSPHSAAYAAKLGGGSAGTASGAAAKLAEIEAQQKKKKMAEEGEDCLEMAEEGDTLAPLVSSAGLSGGRAQKKSWVKDDDFEVDNSEIRKLEEDLIQEEPRALSRRKGSVMVSAPSSFGAKNINPLMGGGGGYQSNLNTFTEEGERPQRKMQARNVNMIRTLVHYNIMEIRGFHVTEEALVTHGIDRRDRRMPWNTEPGQEDPTSDTASLQVFKTILRENHPKGLDSPTRIREQRSKESSAGGGDEDDEQVHEGFNLGDPEDIHFVSPHDDLYSEEGKSRKAKAKKQTKMNLVR